MTREKFDVVILGGGNAGIGVTGPVRRAGMSVAMIEARDLGGTCPTRGCTPKKLLVAAGRALQEIEREGMATAVYTVPALAAVGLTEVAAMQKGLVVDVHVSDMLGWFSAKTYGETVAWSKIIVDRATDRIVGAHLVGHEAQELINVFGLAIKFGITARQLRDHVYAYPTFSADIKHMFAHA
jgi:pyruvate/2-oxoglutarate dehydrogenase complex dihydrolipoamide dehydrogenase (E3) component